MDDVHATAADHRRDGLAEPNREARVVERTVEDASVSAASASVGKRHDLAGKDTVTGRRPREEHCVDALGSEVLCEVIDGALESAGGVERVSGSRQERHPQDAILRRMLSICSQWRAQE
jgi:hypothetical protein